MPSSVKNQRHAFEQRKRKLCVKTETLENPTLKETHTQKVTPNHVAFDFMQVKLVQQIQPPFGTHQHTHAVRPKVKKEEGRGGGGGGGGTARMVAKVYVQKQANNAHKCAEARAGYNTNLRD